MYKTFEKIRSVPQQNGGQYLKETLYQIKTKKYSFVYLFIALFWLTYPFSNIDCQGRAWYWREHYK